VSEDSGPFEALDFVYMPTRDVAAEVEHVTGVLGGRLVFAIEAFDTRVAMVTLADGPPDLLLAGHLEGERSILVYRVGDLDAEMDRLEARGWQRQPSFGIPHGTCCAFRTPDGHRLAIYERTRPEATERFAGRRDF
jgi:catechol 2,3-dioxygenase-like lactoylglutathione lyase family enzyme